LDKVQGAEEVCLPSPRRGASHFYASRRAVLT